MSLLFYDMEFTGLHKETTTISLGIISDDGRRFYAEFNDFDNVQCSDWINENVLSHLCKNREAIADIGGNDKVVFGNSQEIAGELKEWLRQFDSVQFVSDVCHYDFVLLISLFGTAFDLPKNVSPACHDINQDIAMYFLIPDDEAFEKSREDILKNTCGKSIIGQKHNSLYDAEVIKEIYMYLKDLL